jgi:hypothetical protein
MVKGGSPSDDVSESRGDVIHVQLEYGMQFGGMGT